MTEQHAAYLPMLVGALVVRCCCIRSLTMPSSCKETTPEEVVRGHDAQHAAGLGGGCEVLGGQKAQHAEQDLRRKGLP